MFYRKYPSEVEVLNDKDTEIIASNRFMRDMTADEFEKLKRMDWVSSKDKFAKVKAMIPKDNVERFYKNLYLKHNSFSSGMSTWSPLTNGKAQDLEKFWKCHERLNKVKLHTGDYMSMIDKYDSPDTLFYLDPPYPDRAFVNHAKTYGDQFTDDDLKKLIDKLDHVKGKFIISLGTNSEHLMPKHWNVKRVKVNSFMSHGGNEHFKGYRMEILASKQQLREYPQEGRTVEVDFHKKPSEIQQNRAHKPKYKVSSNKTALITSRR